jgi:hypothetical protein
MVGMNSDTPDSPDVFGSVRARQASQSRTDKDTTLWGCPSGPGVRTV